MDGDYELKPCPFCGAEAEFASGYYNDLFSASVDCTNCLASTHADSDRYYNHTTDELENMVIEAWNRRTNNG